MCEVLPFYYSAERLLSRVLNCAREVAAWSLPALPLVTPGWLWRCVVTRRRYLNCTLSSFFADNLSTILTQQRLDLPTPTKEPLCSELCQQTI